MNNPLEALDAAGAELDLEIQSVRKDALVALLPLAGAAFTWWRLRRRRRELDFERRRLELVAHGTRTAEAIDSQLPRWGYDREGLRVELVDGWEPTLFQGGRIVAQVPLSITSRIEACRWLQERVELPGLKPPRKFVVDPEGTTTGPDDEEGDGSPFPNPRPGAGAG